MNEVNLSGVDLNLLVVVDAVLRERSATLAAPRLHLTQSAVSSALRRARALFGDELVVRVGRGFALTSKGEALAPRLRKLLADVHSVLGDDADASRALTIACADAIGVALLPLLLPQLKARLPNVRLRTVTPDYVMTVGLERSDVDLIVGSPTAIPAGCTAEPLLSQPFVVVVDARHREVRSRRITLNAYAQQPHAELALFHEPEDRVDRALALAGRTRRIEVTVPHITTLPFLVAGSDRVATLIDMVARIFAKRLSLQVLRPPVPLEPLSVRMIWHRRRQHDPVHAKLREALRAVADAWSRRASARHRAR